MKSLVKRNLHIIIPTLCLVFAVGVIIILSLRTYEGREISYDLAIEAEGDAVLPVGYEKDGDVFKPIDEGAYLVLPVTDEKINDVRIIFKDGFSSNCEIKLMYATKNSGLSADNSIITEVKRGYSEYYCVLPYDTYTVLECYIPAEVEIESVILSHIIASEPVKDVKSDTSLMIWMLVPTLVAYISVLTALIWIKSSKNRRGQE